MERINQICNELSTRLETLRVRNHEQRPFYPNGTARDFFRMHEESLQELFGLFLGNLSVDVLRDLVRRTVRHVSTILAVVLRVRLPGDITLLGQFAELLVIHQTPIDPPRLNDQNLPIPLNEAQFYFPQRANDFFDTQFQFCAITLRGEHVIYQGDFRSQCPLPYRRQERIGGGAFGQVYRVKIERRHIRSLENNTGNDRPVWLARKDFRGHQAFKIELDVLKKIMKQPQKHNHLVMVLAILQYGDINSLFFPLASCDLHQYLNGEHRAHVPAPTTLEQKKAIYNRGVALAGALAFLHGGFGGAVCLHLDLKPRNVLVYDAYDPEMEIWKITDFGLTRVRNQEHSSAAPGIEGVYLPPECATPKGRVTTQCDVWSFGCIFSLVVTYMLHGSRGVRKFTEKRGERPEGDSFYITTKNSTPRISPAVTYWFDQLRSSVTADEKESKVVRESLDYLQRKALHLIRGQRASAKDVEIALKRIQTHFNPEPPPASPSSLESRNPHKSISDKFRSWMKRQSTDLSVSRLQNFRYDLGTKGFGVRFSPLEGDFLAFFSTHRTLVWTVSEIMSALASGSEIPPPQSLQIPDETIKCFAMSSSSICTCLDGDSFKCYLYNVEGPSSAVRVDDGVRVSYDHMGFIRRVAMSLDGALVAFVITAKPRNLESDCRIYLAYTQHLMDTADSGGNTWSLPRSSRSNSEVSESSFLSVTTAANLIVEKIMIGSAAQIRFLDFTPDGRLLVIIIQEGTSGFSIRAWETYSGKCYRDFSLTIETSQTLRSLFTTCSLYISRSGDPCLAVVADHRRIIHVNLSTRNNNYQLSSVNVDSMFVCDDGQTMVLIGKNMGLRAYLLPVHALDKSEFLGTAKIDSVSYSPALDAAAVKMDENQQVKLLIASSSGNFLVIGLPCSSRIVKRIVERTNATDVPELTNSDETSTVFSDAMTPPGSTKETFAAELCEQLLRDISSIQLPDGAIQELSEALPDYLRAFAVRFDSSDQTFSQARSGIMAFVYKYRGYIADTFMDKYKVESERKGPHERDEMPLDDIMNKRYSHDQRVTGDNDPADIEIDLCSAERHRGDNATRGDIFALARDDKGKSARTDNGELAIKLPKLKMYLELILAAPAYRWLIADIEKHFRLMSPPAGGSESIRKGILKAFPSVPVLSRRSPPKFSKITFIMPWDPIGFCRDQEYREEPPDALARAITLTGSTSVAQALTTSQYLRQTWPSSGQDMLELIQEVLRHPPGTHRCRLLSDGTAVTAWFEESAASGQTKFVASATGTTYTLAELGEQFAWIGASLRSSEYSDGVASIWPSIGSLQVIHDNSKVRGSGSLAEVQCRLVFKVNLETPKSRGLYKNGECWHELFRNPVLVRGFPVARRSSDLGPATGLEVPIHIMARLADAKSLNFFCGRTVIKGFSTILLPTRRHQNVIVWHSIHDQFGDRVSYLECLASCMGHISGGEIDQARHILGWCTEARFLAGSAAAEYDVSGSRLPRPSANCLLQEASIYGEKVISGGVPFSVGYKDSPFHVTRSGYIKKLKWISKKFVILWDEDTKRGWLVNGTSALLHLVRASLEHDSKDKFSSEFIFRSQDFQEPAPDASHKSDSAIGILLNHANRNLEIYREKDGYILFEDRVEHLFRILEQIMDHQVLVLSSYDPPYLAANVSRAYLEGWDFRDLASDLDPIYPRVATLSTPGMAWIEFTRSLKAVALLGQGFGEIMTPIHQRCRQWATLPIGQYNLAVSATDLMEIMDVVGDVGAIPPRLTERLVWYNSEDILLAAHCQCAGQDIDKHIDVVQVILPLYLADKFKTMQARQLGNGAVIFGYNKSIPWFWKETGDPVRGSPGSPDKPMFLFPLSDSGYGPSSEEGSDSTQPTSLQTPAPSDTSPPTSTLQVPLAAPKVKSKIQALSAYTVSIVCALPLELFAVRALFDVTHADGDGITTPSGDPNHYALGEIGKHKVVAACLPDGEYGTNSAADVAANMKRTFTSVKFVLLVGIGGGVPSPANDIRLGDVVVSRPTGNNPGVIQYDMGKILENGVFTQGGFLQPPPRLIMTALSNLRSDPHISRTPLRESLEEIAACKREYRYPGIHLDRLFTSEYPHDPAHETCDDCDMKRLQPRANRPDIQPNSHHPEIHYGTIASGNCVVRDAKFRDHWGTQNNESKILCFEMEAAGIVNTIPCLVIRGICDYSDTHKNKVFQNYAAAAAASYAKLLLSYVKDLRDLEGAVEERNMEGTKRFKSLCKAFSAKCRIQ